MIEFFVCMFLTFGAGTTYASSNQRPTIVVSDAGDFFSIPENLPQGAIVVDNHGNQFVVSHHSSSTDLDEGVWDISGVDGTQSGSSHFSRRLVPNTADNDHDKVTNEVNERDRYQVISQLIADRSSLLDLWCCGYSCAFCFCFSCTEPDILYRQKIEPCCYVLGDCQDFKRSRCHDIACDSINCCGWVAITLAVASAASLNFLPASAAAVMGSLGAGTVVLECMYRDHSITRASHDRALELGLRRRIKQKNLSCEAIKILGRGFASKIIYRDYELDIAIANAGGIPPEEDLYCPSYTKLAEICNEVLKERGEADLVSIPRRPMRRYFGRI